jgi:hypothetical protein
MDGLGTRSEGSAIENARVVPWAEPRSLSFEDVPIGVGVAPRLFPIVTGALLLLSCEACGAPVVRYPSDRRAHVVCDGARAHDCRRELYRRGILVGSARSRVWTVDGVLMRRCSKPTHVGEGVLPLSAFYRRGGGWTSECRPCRRATIDAYRARPRAADACSRCTKAAVPGRAKCTGCLASGRRASAKARAR